MTCEAGPEATGTGERAGADFTARCLGYLAPIFRYVRAAVADSHDAEDLTQEIFAQALARQDQYAGGDLRAWLYQIARNRIAMHYRRHDVERQGAAVLRREAGPGLARTDAGSDTELRAAALAALAELEETEREALRLKFSEAYENKAIARLLGVTPGNLGVILFRALRKLRRTLERQGHAEL